MINCDLISDSLAPTLFQSTHHLFVSPGGQGWKGVFCSLTSLGAFQIGGLCTRVLFKDLLGSNLILSPPRSSRYIYYYTHSFLSSIFIQLLSTCKLALRIVRNVLTISWRWNWFRRKQCSFVSQIHFYLYVMKTSQSFCNCTVSFRTRLPKVED